MIREAIMKLSRKEDLTYHEAEEVMNEIMEGKATDVQMAAYLTALSLKGETIDEITASAAGMRAHCVKLLHDMDVLEIVGTGGDGANSFNISTTSALVIAAAGVPVAKHGNRAASSKCGAADVLEALGVKITLPPGAERAASVRGQYLLFVCPELPHRYEVCGSNPQRTGNPHGLQHFRGRYPTRRAQHGIDGSLRGRTGGAVGPGDGQVGGAPGNGGLWPG